MLISLSFISYFLNFLIEKLHSISEGYVADIRHFYHVVSVSPWPYFVSMFMFSVAFGAITYVHGYTLGGFVLFIGFCILTSNASSWWRDVIREGTFEGSHTKQIIEGLRLGMIMFIASEVMFFFAFFWGFFHSSLDPVVELGCVWPPVGIKTIAPFGYSALFGTTLLLLSGCAITVSHHSFMLQKEKIEDSFFLSLIFLLFTIVLGSAFTVFQYIEYKDTNFNISDSVYGSTFFLTTGFHGFHVLIGTLFLFVQFLRVFTMQIGPKHFVGFESAIWYWHFVDVVWLFVYSSIYLWGSLTPKTSLIVFV